MQQPPSLLHHLQVPRLVKTISAAQNAATTSPIMQLCAHIWRCRARHVPSGRKTFLTSETLHRMTQTVCGLPIHVILQLADVITEEESRSIIAPDEMNEGVVPAPAPAPAPTTHDIPSDFSTAALRRVQEPYPSVGVSNLGGMNLLQQLQAGIGSTPEATQARATGLPFYPFSGRGDWQLAKWLNDSPLSQADIDKFLKLDQVCPRLHCALLLANR